MDNLTHSLVGATMAQAGLKRMTPLATSTLVIGANLPDIDAVVTVLGSDASLYFRRGITHGVVALLVLPLVLTAAMMLYDRYVRRRRDPEAEPARVGALIFLAYLGTLSHPFLDWLNTYGVRLLMPFDGRWFYGDTLFIIDPWFWLLMAASVVLVHSRTRFSKVMWTIAAILATALVTFVGMVPLGAKIVWWVGLLVLVALRVRGLPENRVPKIANGCLVALLLYLAAMMSASSLSSSQVEDWLQGQGIEVVETMASPLPANPFSRTVVVVTEEAYHFVDVRWLASERLSFAREPVPIEEPGPIARAALEDPSVRGMRNWIRYPAFEVVELEDGYRVYIRDMRYATRDSTTGIGVAIVELDEDLVVR